MTPDQKLMESYARGLENGFDSLSREEQDLFLIEDFIFEFELGSLTGYLYNRLPDVPRIRATIAAMQRCGLTDLAKLLSEAANLFSDYVDPDSPTTWGAVLKKYDPAGSLRSLDHRITALENFGLNTSDIR
jgi:hypothetical protein